MPNMLTIREAVKRAKAEGLPISEYTLRLWIKTGAIPVRRIGQKALIFYPNLVRYLQCTDDQPAKSAQRALDAATGQESMAGWYDGQG